MPIMQHTTVAIMKINTLTTPSWSMLWLFWWESRGSNYLVVVVVVVVIVVVVFVVFLVVVVVVIVVVVIVVVVVVVVVWLLLLLLLLLLLCCRCVSFLGAMPAARFYRSKCCIQAVPARDNQHGPRSIREK